MSFDFGTRVRYRRVWDLLGVPHPLWGADGNFSSGDGQVEAHFALFARYILAVLSRYVPFAPFLVFIGGLGALATVRHVGVPWIGLLFGTLGFDPRKVLLAIAVAVPTGLVLGLLDEYVTLKLYTKCAAARTSESKDWAENFPFFSSNIVTFLTFLLWTFGEEGIRAGLLFGVGSLVHPRSLVMAFTVGILMGVSHGIYGRYAIPAKIVDSIIFSLALLYFGLVVSFILHFTLNFYMAFLEIKSTRRESAEKC